MASLRICPDNALDQGEGPRRLDEEASAGVRQILQREPDLQGPALRRRQARSGRLLALGITGPPLRATGYDWDLRKKQPYCGYETYDFEVQTWDTCDAYGRFRIRLNEMWESLKIIEQCVERLEKMQGDPVMVGRQEDRLARAAVHRLATGWATPTSTSSTSWASRWRR